METRENIFQNFVNIVAEYQGEMLKRLSNAVEPALIALVNGELQPFNRWPIERINPEIFDQQPKGSEGIFELLWPRYEQSVIGIP